MLKSVGWTGHRNITVSHQENEKPSGFTSEMPTTHGICSFRILVILSLSYKENQKNPVVTVTETIHPQSINYSDYGT